MCGCTDGVSEVDTGRRIRSPGSFCVVRWSPLLPSPARRVAAHSVTALTARRPAADVTCTRGTAGLRPTPPRFGRPCYSDLSAVHHREFEHRADSSRCAHRVADSARVPWALVRVSGDRGLRRLGPERAQSGARKADLEPFPGQPPEDQDRRRQHRLDLVAGASMRQPPGVSYTITKQWLSRHPGASHGASGPGSSSESTSRPKAPLGRGGNSGAGQPSAHGQSRRSSSATSLSSIAAGAGTARALAGRSPDVCEVIRLSSIRPDFSKITTVIPRDLPLAGPTVGIHTWFPGLPEFLAANRRVRVVTLHRYPLQSFVSPASPVYPSVSNLLSDAASRGLADSIAPYVRVAHAHHLPLRIGAMNTVSAGQAPGVADSFASALWILDALFNMARVGVDGVNIHTFRARRTTFSTSREHRVSGKGSSHPSTTGC